MPCICGDVTCICYYVCTCQPQTCFCKVCIGMRDPLELTTRESPSKQNHGQNKSQPGKKPAQNDPSNEQMSSLANVTPPGQSQMKQSPASDFDKQKQTLGSSPATKAPKPSTNEDPYPIIRKRLSQPALSSDFDPHPLLKKRLSETAPPSNYDPHATLKKQLSQPTPPPNYDPHATLKRQLSQPCKIPIRGSLFPELPSSDFLTRSSSTGGSSLSSVSNSNPSLTPTSKTSSTKASSASGSNKVFKSGNSSKSRSKKVPTIPSDSNNSCSNIEYIKKASDKALPSFESFSSRFTTPASDENNNSNNSNFGLTTSTSENQGTRQASTDLSGHCSEINTPVYPETSFVTSDSSCNNPGSQSLQSPNPVPLQLSPQELPLNLTLSSEDRHKISFSHSLELSSRSPSSVSANQQRMDTMEFSNIPNSESDNQRSESAIGGSNDTFLTRQEFLSSDSIVQGSYPKTRSESTASTSGSAEYTSCIVQNPSQYTVRTGQYESPMETEASSRNFDQNFSYPISTPSTSGFFSPPETSDFSQASDPNIIIYSNDLNDGRNFTLQMNPSNLHNLQEIQNSQSASMDINRFSETSENPYFEHEVYSTSYEQTSSTDRQSVIKYQSSRLPSQSTSVFSPGQVTNPLVNVSYQAQSHRASSSTFPPSINVSHARLLASRASNETPINPQASTHFQPTSSDVNMVPAFSTDPSTESIESNAGSQEHMPHLSQSSIVQSASSGLSPSRRTIRYKDDETGENKYTNRSKRRLS